jgi:PTH1 family peptidyl-tRNA hydrolase
VRLIVGLGNPGERYEDTRHNVGFWLLEALARQKGALFRLEPRFHGEALRVSLHGQEIWLLKPGTYMNRSGQAVAALARFYKITPDETLVVHDDLDLPPGHIRFKKGGGHGGHNGLKDIQAHLGTPEYHRLRIGIGHPGVREQVADYVLHAPGRLDRQRIDQALDECAATLPLILEGELARATQRLHSHKPSE